MRCVQRCTFLHFSSALRSSYPFLLAPPLRQSLLVVVLAKYFQNAVRLSGSWIDAPLRPPPQWMGLRNRHTHTRARVCSGGSSSIQVHVCVAPPSFASYAHRQKPFRHIATTHAYSVTCCCVFCSCCNSSCKCCCPTHPHPPFRPSRWWRSCQRSPYDVACICYCMTRGIPSKPGKRRRLRDLRY